MTTNILLKTFEHFEEMTGLIVLRDAHLNSVAAHIVIHFHSLKSRSTFFILGTLISLEPKPQHFIETIISSNKSQLTCQK